METMLAKVNGLGPSYTRELRALDLIMRAGYLCFPW